MVPTPSDIVKGMVKMNSFLALGALMGLLWTTKHSNLGCTNILVISYTFSFFAFLTCAILSEAHRIHAFSRPNIKKEHYIFWWCYVAGKIVFGIAFAYGIVLFVLTVAFEGNMLLKTHDTCHSGLLSFFSPDEDTFVESLPTLLCNFILSIFLCFISATDLSLWCP
ncbi:uncharacterized protein DS421_17g578470 [Arachis hypogaea]|nr:uncharacterized protein DS421_17g578470 [Arachis hypogaea]